MANRQKRSSELECVAYHEAGHAVVAFALHRAVRRVSIVPDRAALTAGRCMNGRLSSSFELVYDWTNKTQVMAQREIMIRFAGGIAEARFRGQHDHFGSSHDRKVANYMATLLSGDEEEAEKYLAWLAVRTKNLLVLPWHWQAVTNLAAELLVRREVSGREARLIYLHALSHEQAPAL